MRRLMNLPTLPPLTSHSPFEAIAGNPSPIHHGLLLEERTLSLMRSAHICHHQPTFVVATLFLSLPLSSPLPTLLRDRSPGLHRCSLVICDSSSQHLPLGTVFRCDFELCQHYFDRHTAGYLLQPEISRKTVSRRRFLLQH